jgi:hypothetical protein
MSSESLSHSQICSSSPITLGDCQRSLLVCLSGISREGPQAHHALVVLIVFSNPEHVLINLSKRTAPFVPQPVQV